MEDLHDEVALKYKWSVKGHAGLKPCFLCTNVLSKDHAALSRHPSFRCLSHLDAGHFVLATDEDLWQAQDELIRQSSLVRKGELEKLETACGQRCEPLGLLACQELRPYVKPTRSVYDAMHCYFCGGIAEVECDLLFARLTGIGFSVENITAFCNDRWRPRRKLVFTTKGLKGMAREVLTTVFVFWHLCITVLQPHGLLPAECASWCALAKIVQCLQQVKMFEKVPDAILDRLERLQKVHADLFKAAYGKEHVKPKHHYSMHIPQQTKRKGMLVDSWPVERKERLMKAVLEQQKSCGPNINLPLSVNVNLIQLDEMVHQAGPGTLVGATSMTQIDGVANNEKGLLFPFLFFSSFLVSGLFF